MVLDEGGMGLTTVGDVVYARPGVAERGYMDAELILEVQGGHSSQPPAHSGIGIMAEMIMALEEYPYAPMLTAQNPLKRYLECQAKFSPREIEPWLLDELLDEEDGTKIGRRLSEARGPMVRFSMQTSQAVDIIRGGDKVNALPETVTTIVNYRIAPHNSLVGVKSRISQLLGAIAHDHGLKLQDFHHNDEQSATETNTSSGTLALRSLNDLPPSPITPTDLDNKAWHLFSATIRQVFENTTTLDGRTVVPVGDIMQGNTDTIHYWNLTPNIYRFSPAREGTRLGIHTIDERVDMTAHAEGMRLYYGKCLLYGSFFSPLEILLEGRSHMERDISRLTKELLIKIPSSTSTKQTSIPTPSLPPSRPGRKACPSILIPSSSQHLHNERRIFAGLFIPA